MQNNCGFFIEERRLNSQFKGNSDGFNFKFGITSEAMAYY